MKTISKAQITKIHVLLTKADMIDDKAKIVHYVTNGRTTSTKGLTNTEAKQMIDRLTELANARQTAMACFKPIDRQRLAIINLARKAGIIYGISNADNKMNVAKLNLFLRERGAVKRHLGDMSFTETVKVHRQFEAILKNIELSHERKMAALEVDNLLSDLNLVVA